MTLFPKSPMLLCALDAVLEIERTEKYMRLATVTSAICGHEKAMELFSRLLDEDDVLKHMNPEDAKAAREKILEEVLKGDQDEA